MHLSTILKRRALRWLLVPLLGACTDAYLPEVIQSPPSYLVVDGFLNARGITTVKLSRTYAVGSKALTPPLETKAGVYLEEENGARTQLRETVPGTYASPTALALSTARRYRLHLTTAGGREYASDFVPARLTPPIDSLSWRPAAAEGLTIGVSTHDPANATRYYRWDHTETWEIRPIYRPTVQYVPNTFPLPNITVPFPTLCYATENSTSVKLYKTTALSQDLVSQFPLKQLPSTSERLYTRYSILVQQQALTQEEYAYWELLRKNTESIGSIFDPQPASLTGNVHCLSHPNELALGYVSAHSVSEQRLFINRAQLPTAWRVRTGYEDCLPEDTVYVDRPAPPPPDPIIVLQSYFTGGAFIPIDPIKLGPTKIIGYTAKSKDCIDCRTRGTAIKPSFWP